MFNHKTRVAMVAGIAAITLLAGLPASQSFAQCCGYVPAVTSYARPYSAGRISWTSSYGVSSTCNPWVPGSCGYSVYRPVAAYSPISTRTYMPVTTTAYSPSAAGANCVTTLQTRQVPGQPIRNLFRMLLPPYRPVPVTTCYTPTTAYYPSSCNACYSASYAPGSCVSCDPCNGCVSGVCDGGSVTPTYYNGTAPSSGNGAPSTYKQESRSDTELRLMPTPDANTEPATFSVPREIESDTRTAMQPFRQAVLYRPVSLSGPSRAASATIDVGGWRASSD